MMIALCGCWLLALGGMQAANPEKYGRSAMSFFGWGVLFIAVGGALFVVGFGLVYAFAIVLLALAGLAIFAAFQRK